MKKLIFAIIAIAFIGINTNLFAQTTPATSITWQVLKTDTNYTAAYTAVKDFLKTWKTYGADVKLDGFTMTEEIEITGIPGRKEAQRLLKGTDANGAEMYALLQTGWTSTTDPTSGAITTSGKRGDYNKGKKHDNSNLTQE